MSPLYFDYQASTPVAGEVLREMQPFFTDLFANPHSLDHAFGWKSALSIDRASRQVADLIGADSDEIIFTSGATEANNLALLGLARRAIRNGSGRKRVLLSAIEHKSLLAVGRILEKQFDFTVNFIPVDGSGHVILSELDKLLRDDVLIVSIMAVNNEIGTIQDISSLSMMIKGKGAFFHCDAAQAPMAMIMERFADHVDLLSLSGHKIYGPKGIGVLYVDRDIQNKIEPIMYGGEQQSGIRPGTLPTPLCVGMGAAAQYISSPDVCKKREALRIARDRFMEMLSNLSWPLIFHGSEKRHPGNISVGFQGFDAKDILGLLQPRLAASTGSACTSGLSEPSHVLKAIGLTAKQADSVIRFSLGFDTTDLEIDEAIEIIDRALHEISNR